MFKEVDMIDAVMATLRGETVYAITEKPDDQRPYIDPVGIYKINDLLESGEKHRYIWDEPQEVEIEIVPENTVTIRPEDISDIYAGEPEELPFTPEKSELEGFATYDPTVKRKGGRYPKVDVGKLMALHNAGWDEDKIAGELGVTRGTVMRYLREEGAKDD